MKNISIIILIIMMVTISYHCEKNESHILSNANDPSETATANGDNSTDTGDDSTGIDDFVIRIGGEKEDVGYQIQQTIDGGYIIVGYTKSYGSGGKDIYFIRTDSEGNPIWEETFGGPGDDIGYSVQQTSDGGFILCGFYEDDSWLIKTDNSGNIIWEKKYDLLSDTDLARYVLQTNDKGYILTGFTHGYIDYYDDSGWMFVLKTDENGNILWSAYPELWKGSGYCIKQTSDSAYIAAGTFDYIDWTPCWIKINDKGDIEWSKYRNTYGRVKDIHVLDDGSIFLCGSYWAQGIVSGIIFAKLNQNGNLLYFKKYLNWHTSGEGGAVVDGGYFHPTKDGGFIITGEIYDYDNNYYIFFGKMNSEGNEIGRKVYRNNFGRISSKSITQDSYTNFAVTGSIEYQGNTDVFFLKVDSDGELIKPAPPGIFNLN